jgi:hypothetical protein
MTINSLEVGTTVYATADYSVVISSVVDAETKQDIVVYGLVNNSTGVREAELRALTTAMVWANKVQSDLNEQREAEAQAATIVAAMPTGEEDGYRDDEEVEEFPAPPALTEEEARNLLDATSNTE